MEKNSIKNLILDISVNLSRVSEFILDDREYLVDMFLNQTKEYLSTITEESISAGFKQALYLFRNEFNKLLADRHQGDKEEWAERALTWANILQHRAKLA